MSQDDEWLFVTEQKDLPDRGMKAFFPKGIGLLLFRSGEHVTALSNRCPHLGCTLAQGSLSNGVITCPCHDWSFDVRTGENILAHEVKVRSFQTIVREGKVFVSLR